MKVFLFSFTTSKIESSGKIVAETMEAAIINFFGRATTTITPLQTVHSKGRTYVVQAEVQDKKGGTLQIVEFSLDTNHRPLAF